MEAETETMVEKREIINNVMCLLTDPDGTPFGAPMYLPQNAGPQHLNQIVNKLLNNVTKPPYSYSQILFYIFLVIIIIITLSDYLCSHFRRRNCRMLSIYQMRSSLCHLKHTCRKTKASHV